MLDTIAHRGPDDSGSYFRGSIGLGNRRLSIIDLQSGKQPISNEDGTIWVVYNGEMYNYPHLRAQLESKGHVFRTNSDTEVIVHLYEEFGERCVERISGMFAFGLWDENQQKLLLARDRIGQKPLFYAQDGADFLFGSEIKSILAIRQREPELDPLAMHDYFQFVVIAALGWNLWRVLSADVRPAPGDQARLQFEPKCEPKWWKTTALAGLAFAPFFLPALVGIQSLSERPPPGVMTKQVTPNGYQVRVVGQPAGMSMYWYSAFSDGRHHTVEACMRFRGITLENVDSEEFVFMGDDKWYREFFIQGGHLAASYGEYLVSTLVPLSDAGVHIIVQAPKSQMSASYFAKHSEKLAARIFKMHAEAS